MILKEHKISVQTVYNMTYFEKVENLIKVTRILFFPDYENRDFRVVSTVWQILPKFFFIHYGPSS